MTNTEYDIIIIGAGLGGLTAGALLSGFENKKVLILERESYLGGRIVSFTGKEDRLVLHDRELDVPEFKKVLSSVYTWVSRSEPDLDTIFKNRLLDGYSFEAGGHATFWGNRGRIGYLLEYLKTPVDLPGNEGFAVVDPEKNELHSIEKGGNYGWMSEDSNRTAKTLLREMVMASDDRLKEWDRISFGQWLNDRTDDRKVYEFLAAIASIHMVMGEPDMIPAGDFIRFMHTAARIGMNLVSGSTGIVPKPGFVRITERIAETIHKNNGTILNNACVSEIIFDGSKATGVRFVSDSGEQTVLAENIICTVPIKKIWPFLPEQRFEGDFVKTVKQDFFSVGMLTGYIGVKSNLFADAGINPKSWLLLPSLIKAEEGFIGDVDIISIMPSNFSPTLAPEGKYSFGYSIALTDRELRDKTKVDRVIEATKNKFNEIFPQLKADTDWELWTCSDKGFGDWPPPGQPRPDTTQPGIEGLFFAGDGYGSSTWGSGMDAAVYSALLCVDAITGKNYIERVLPEYHR
ncbi:FAD-dependent oxidoreductase [bacterium]|nr:FAD-dependent oxidoreductase [bacterium]